MTWAGIHCRLSWAAGDVDTFIVDSLAPTIDGLKQSGLIADWYYLRYWETGPHLRVRVRDAEPATIEKIIVELRGLVAAADFPVQDIDSESYYAAVGVSGLPWYPHGDVREVDYVPETARYGGPGALPLAEEVFCRSTEVACAVLRATDKSSARLTAAIELAIATARALDLDRPAAAAWLRTMVVSWRVTREPAPTPSLAAHASAHQLLAARGPELAERWHREPRGALRYWVDAIRAARARLTGPMLDVWASQLHMLFNRLGVSPHEERTVCSLVAATALRPNGLTSFHDDSETTADRMYVEASKFLSGFTEQFPRRDTPAPHRRHESSQKRVELPAPAPIDATLTSALRSRQTSHEFSGSLTAEQLVTLLWTAHSPTESRHPHPSAGARYSARLRLLALDVTGLDSGIYGVDEVGRTLHYLANAPSIADIEATSMWFDPVVAPLANTPALLALYVEVGSLRQTYGVRALRFAYSEAGHLAQNLGLVAAALSIRMGLLGGFYDDLANDLFLLDGVNNSLVYLLPLAANGHAPGAVSAQRMVPTRA